MESLQRLTRRQIETLGAIQRCQSPDRGAALTAIARALGISPPSALDHVSMLEDSGLIVRYRGKSRLTPKGGSTLVEYQRHHRVAETMFANLGLSPEATCSAAREIDLAISHRTIEEICRAEQHPSACPHGEPIAPCSTRRVGRGS